MQLAADEAGNKGYGGERYEAFSVSFPVAQTERTYFPSVSII